MPHPISFFFAGDAAASSNVGAVASAAKTRKQAFKNAHYGWCSSNAVLAAVLDDLWISLQCRESAPHLMLNIVLQSFEFESM